jgi:hypothetical protein
MNKRNTGILVIGIVLIFLSVYLFTRPAFFTSFDLSETGQIGDTIGGITAPIINLIGAVLVYFSFQAQLDANKIQSVALSDEKERLKKENVYQKHLSQLEEIKNTLRTLEFVVEFQGEYTPNNDLRKDAPIVFKGLNALNEYTNRIVALKDNRTSYHRQIYQIYSMFLNYKFMLQSLDELINSIETKIIDETDKIYLLNNINLFYNSFLKVFGDRIIYYYGEENTEVVEIIKIRDFLNNKFTK